MPPIDQGQSSGEQTSTGTDDPSTTTATTTTTTTTTTTATATGEDESSSGSTSTGEDATSTGEVGSQTWCADEDADGFGDPGDCQEVADDTDPPAGWVADDSDCDDGSARTFPGAATEEAVGSCTKDADEDGWADAAPPAGVEPGTDCLDDDADTFPGAAELDDASACMRDADDDGYGDSLPPAGAMAGTDCDDADASVPSATACLTWCADADQDQYGDPNTCVIDVEPPKGYVGNAADCDDLEALVFDACFDCPADTFFCNAEGNAAQCNATGTWGVEVQACGFGCDDTMGACWSALTVDAGTCAELLAGGSATLTANASGGDGSYAYAWSPTATLDVADAASVTATPSNPTTYAVSVSDGEANVAGDRVTVHITNEDWTLEDGGCSTFVYADIFDAPAPNPSGAFFNGGTARCNLANNSLPNAFVCPAVMEQTQVAFDLEVVNAADNDGIGFVYGWQDASHFSLFSWKQSPEVAPWGTWEQGVTIKRIEADDPADITGEDLAASYDTAHGTILATPADFFTGGWTNQVLYRVSVDLDGPNTTITIVDQDNGNTTVATGTVIDATHGPGAIGSYDASQRSVCTDHWLSSCL